MGKKLTILKVRAVKQPIDNTTHKKTKIRSTIEMISWIIGIVCGLILIQQAFFPHLFEKNKGIKSDSLQSIKRSDSSSITDSINRIQVFSTHDPKIKKAIIKNSVISKPIAPSAIVNRHASTEDIAYILDSIPHKYFVAINYENGFESREYAYSLSEKLSSLGYRNMGYIVDSVPPLSKSKRFFLVKHNDTAVIYIKRIAK